MIPEFDGGFPIESRIWWTLNLANNKRHVLRLFIKLCHRRLLRQLLTWSRTISGTHTHIHTNHHVHALTHKLNRSARSLSHTNTRTHVPSCMYPHTHVYVHTHTHAHSHQQVTVGKREVAPLPAMCTRELKRWGGGFDCNCSHQTTRS